MKSYTTRLPLAIALTSALAFAAGCDNRSAEERAAMQSADPAAAPVAPTETAPVDPAMPNTSADNPANVPRDGLGNNDSEQPIDDTWITTKVKSSLLADADVSGLDIKVETVNGVVTLSGDVEQQSQIEHAAQIARGIQGVTEVRSTGLVAR